MASEPAGLLLAARVERSCILFGTGIVDPQNIFLRVFLGFLIAPVIAILFYGTARLVAMGVARWMPESALKRRLLTDTESGRLAYKPRGRSGDIRKG